MSPYLTPKPEVKETPNLACRLDLTKILRKIGFGVMTFSK